jgi:hypothetical protein
MLNFPSFFNAQVGYEIEQSLRFDGSSHLNFTPSSTASTRRQMTFSFWSKHDGTYNIDGVFTSGTASFYDSIVFDGDTCATAIANSGATGLGAVLYPAARLRDPGAWLHYVMVLDTPNATAGDRLRIYINGERVTAFASSPVAADPDPGQNYDTKYWNTTATHRLGSAAFSGSPDRFFSGYLAEVHCVFGSALDPTDFGEFDNNGVWRPIAYTGSYGTNGFYLKFDPTATNGIGHDHSGNGNNFTPTGFNTNPDSYVLATKTSGSFNTGTLRDVFDTNSGNAGGVYSQTTTGSAAASTIDIEFSSALSGTITVTAADGTGSTNNGGQYQLIDSTDTVQVTQARPTSTTTFTHTGLSDITKLRMYGGSSGPGGILISRFESSDQTIRTADWLGEGDVMSDTPTTNWCTLNPLSPSQSEAVLANGNLNCTWTGVSGHTRRSTIAAGSGKWYAEIIRGTSTLSVGLVDADLKLLSWPGNSTYGSTGSYAYRTDDGNKYNNGSGSSYGSTVATGDVIGIAYDGDNGALYFSKNGTWQNSGDPTSGASATGAAFTGLGNQTWTIACGNAGGSTNGTATNFNFGQRAFAYTPPTGFEALNTANLPAPTVKDGSSYFDTVTYSGATSGTAGAGTTQAVTGLGFSPDLVWIKNRSNANSHGLFDQVRGAVNALRSDLTNAEATTNSSGALSAFNSNGFTLANGSSGSDQAILTHQSGYTYVAWNWKANGTGSSNTDGTITSTVSANPTAGFSIGTYTADGSNANRTVGHGLGVAPEFIIVKNRDTTGRHWLIWHKGFNDNDKALLFTTAAVADNRFGPSAPTSTVFGLYGGQGNYNSDDHVFYAFAGVEGYSKFGTYTGNGNSDGPFVYCGFKPRWIMIKAIVTGEWQIVDTERSPNNPTQSTQTLEAQDAGAESNFTSRYWNGDILSNGWKYRGVQQYNATNRQYIYAAFAEHPTGGSGVSPATAR